MGFVIVLAPSLLIRRCSADTRRGSSGRTSRMYLESTLESVDSRGSPVYATVKRTICGTRCLASGFALITRSVSERSVS